MKKFLTIALFAATTAAMAQTGLGVGASPSSTQQQGTQTGNQSAPQAGAQPGGSDQQQKVIKDQAEYNAYMTATTTQDPGQKAQALEAFVQQYPNSVVKEDALEAAMAAYQQAGNAAKASQVADTLLQVNPNNLSALAVEVYSARAAANQGQNTDQNLAKAGEMSQRGLQTLQTATKPPGVSDADWQKRQGVFKLIFQGAAGQAAFQAKNYAQAHQLLFQAAATNQNDFYDNYFAGVSAQMDKQADPQTQLQGLWYLARATNLSNNNAQVVQIAQYYYKKYHGGMDGYDQLLAAAKASATMPQGMTITKYTPPSPQEQAAQMVQQKPNPADMDTGEWVFVLSSGNQQAADTVWNFLNGKAIKFVAKVVESSPEKLGVALTADAFQSNTKEAEVTMTTPYKTAPQVGSQVELQGTARSYTPNPFLLVMDEGIDLSKPVKAPVKKKAPVRRRVTRKRAH